MIRATFAAAIEFAALAVFVTALTLILSACGTSRAEPDAGYWRALADVTREAGR